VIKATRCLLIFYLILLVWVLLFKYPIDIAPVMAILRDPDSIRIMNFIPFYETLEGAEVWFNLLIFIPLGLFLGMVFPKAKIFKLVLFAFVFSTIIELLQFILALGYGDVTDILLNTLGAFIGLQIHFRWTKLSEPNKLDRPLLIAGYFICFTLIAGALYMAIVRGYHIMPIQP